MKKIILFSMAVLMSFATTAFVCISFALLDAKLINLLFIMLLSIIGYGGSVWYYHSYLQQKQ